METKNDSILEKMQDDMKFICQSLVNIYETLQNHSEFILEDKKTLKSILEWIDEHEEESNG